MNAPPEPTEEARAKREALADWLRRAGSVAVAYSGGTDSSFLLLAAHEALGEHAVGVIGISASLAGGEREEALATARAIGARVEVLETEELDDPRYRENTTNRCFFCKHELFGKLLDWARANDFAAVLDGTNYDDLQDHRPGRTAAGEQGVRSPLLELGFTKQEIRALSYAAGLPTWDKPAAPCLSSRIPYGTPVTPEVLAKVDAGEAAIRSLGIRVFRLRHHDTIARIEVGPEDFGTILERREELIRRLREAGYRFVTLDLEGFRSGRLNEGSRRP
ncbi:MAG: ATP-dependent sacrificial sulfur transferase LarE [Candidatus Eisenbacteria bacterium]|nr:ATP-dependent sacrificial sulfur transferase LarE [Candidatus Latescibacterota bacterium]MBD3302462.1 ATP-dependent sacrificial sulfur transferase LarE [Candidatus Eisenbacteria bacterium]